jgi:biopolymer transport protein ExbB/TolQ
MDWRMALAQHAAERSAKVVHRRMARGLRGLATVAATAPFVGMIGTCWGMVNSSPGCGGNKSTCMAAVAALLSESIMPAALGLAVAITASWGYQYLGGRMADFDAGMQDAVRSLPDLLGKSRVSLPRRG